jgi:hypothetical protein
MISAAGRSCTKKPLILIGDRWQSGVPNQKFVLETRTDLHMMTNKWFVMMKQNMGLPIQTPPQLSIKCGMSHLKNHLPESAISVIMKTELGNEVSHCTAWDGLACGPLRRPQPPIFDFCLRASFFSVGDERVHRLLK